MPNFWEKDTPVKSETQSGGLTGDYTVDSFKDTYGPAAAKAGKALGVDPSLILAQWGNETRYGKSVIPGTNNLGNIKGVGVPAKDNALGTTDQYKKYNSPEEFADDYASLMMRKYPGVVGAGNDVNKFTSGLKGYAQDPNYASKVAKVSNKIGPVSEKNSGGNFWEKDTPYKPESQKAPTTSENKEVAPPPPGPSGSLGFISGNLNKGIAQLAGLPVDVARYGINAIPKVSAYLGNKIAGKDIYSPITVPSNSVGGSEYIENKMRGAGLINESSTPTSTAGEIGAAALQFAPGLVAAAPELVINAPRAGLNLAKGLSKGISEGFRGGAPARSEAISGVTKGVGSGIGKLSSEQPASLTHADVGDEIISNYNKAMSAAEANKSAVGKKLYGNMYKEASERASLGNGFRSGKITSLEDAVEQMKDQQSIVNNAKGDFSRAQVREAQAKASELRSAINSYTKDFNTPYSKITKEFGDAASALDVKGTSLGRKFGTEGGIGRDLYEKTSPDKIGASVFRNKTSIQEYEDALAGGANASPEARAAAKEKVTELLEKHLRASFAESSPAQIARHVAAPQNQSLYNYAPKVQSSIEAMGKNKLAQEFSEDFNNFNKTFAGKNDAEALQEANKLLRSANVKGIITNDQYMTVRNLVDRAESAQQKRDILNKVFWDATKVSAVGAGGAAAYRLTK